LFIVLWHSFVGLRTSTRALHRGQAWQPDFRHVFAETVPNC